MPDQIYTFESDGKRYRLQGPVGLTEDDLAAAIGQQQSPVSNLPDVPGRADPETARSNANFDANVTQGALGLAGIPMSTLVNLANLGIAGYGTAKQMLGLGVGPNTINPASVPGTSPWNINRAGAAAQPTDEPGIGHYLGAIERGLPSAVLNPSAPLANIGYSLAGQAVNDTVKDPTANAITQAAMMFGPGLVKGGMKDYAAGKLAEVRANNPARSDIALQNAEDYTGGNLTLAQTSNSGLVRSLATQVQGQKAADVGQMQADQVALKLTQQARTLAPVPITAPGAAASTASKVGQAIDKMSTDLTDQATRGYEKGVSQVTALSRIKPEPVSFPALTATFKRLQGEVQDIYNTAPAELQPRISNLLTSLGGGNESWYQKVNGEGITAPTALDAMKLGKAINQIYSSTERGAVTDKMDAVFAQLKSAYKTDLNSAPSNPAIDRLRSVNDEYANAADRIDTLHKSVVNEIVGALGTKDPDAAVSKMAGMNPSAQRYTRDMLLKYDPNTLRALQGHYIDLHLQEASPPGQNVFQSKTDIQALNPESLAKTGLFDPKSALELNKAQDAINTIRGFFPETVGNKVGVNLQAASRLGGGALGGHVSPVFGFGMILQALSGGQLERLLLTPEGRASLTQGATSRASAASLAQKIALYNQAVSQAPAAASGQ